MLYPCLTPARRRALAGAALTAALVPAAPASAAPSPSCDKQNASPVFAAFGDRANYFLAPGGDFEDGAAGWTLSAGAAVTGGGDSLGFGAPADDSSLVLPKGASATSAPFCIRRGARVVRWLQRGTRKSSLAVEVIHLSPDARKAGRKLGKQKGRATWAPSRKVGIPLGGTGQRGSDGAPVALKFTARRGSWAIDDLYVDPMLRR